MSKSRSASIILASSSLVICTCALLRWRARARARTVADRARRMTADGPMIDGNDEEVQHRVLMVAIKRASKWMSYQNTSMEKMKGQVGGISKNKRPMMTLAPDYVMKHVRCDHRGYREVAFYEAIKSGLKAGEQQRSSHFGPMESIDMLAMWLAMSLHDPVVVESEQALIKGWRASKKEAELLRRLSNFTPSYYGVVTQGERQSRDSFVMSDTNYILLQDVTAKFSGKPCAIDIKMGTQTYEPDASLEKRTREYEKYVHQETFGIRIVAMRVYDPSHPDADSCGYRTFPKVFGRSLGTREDILRAFKIFFGVRTRVITNVLMQLRLLRKWFENNDCIAFYASSLLIVYGGDATRGDATSTKMIDFGHVRRKAGGDEGYLQGLRTLISILRSLLEDNTHTSIQ